MIELLAPAGDMECLRAAVNNGADAVYIGGKYFSARAFAENFNFEDMKNAADYCHLRGARLYVTLNTMMMEHEIESGIQFARNAYLAGADALIVADIGLAAKIAADSPEIALHASTQTCVHNAAGAAIAADIGMKRVVLARELSIADIKEIAKDGRVETEVFIHGALCSSVSGLCLLSSFIGERSGNRGKCAQPCRLEYEIDEKKAYYLSMADLCAAGLMNELISAGVASFKIEGRMKNSRYVGGVVREYRHILDDIAQGKKASKESFVRLQDYYNRSFTDEYLRGGTDVLATDMPGNRNIDKDRTREAITEKEEKIFNRLKANVRLIAGQPAVIELNCGDFSTWSQGDLPLEVGNKPFDRNVVLRSVEKTGGTPFTMEHVNVEAAGNPFIRLSEMNNLRSRAISQMEDVLLNGYHTRKCNARAVFKETETDHSLRSVYVQTNSIATAIKSLRAGAERIYYAPLHYDFKSIMKAGEIAQDGKKPYLVLPPFTRQADMQALDEMLRETHTLFDGALAGNFSQIGLLKKYFTEIVADYTCNIANSATVDEYKKMGFTGIALSAELNKKNINSIESTLPVELIAYGRLPLMWLAHPLESGEMRDRLGYEYTVSKIKITNELIALQNPVLLYMREIQGVSHHADALRLILAGEDEADVLLEYIHAVCEARNVEPLRENTTQGHIKRGV